MTYNRILGFFAVGVCAVSCYLTRVAVCWDDHRDIGIVEHFFDIHIDHDHIIKDAEKEYAESQQRQRDYDNFVAEVRSFSCMDEECCAQ